MKYYLVAGEASGDLHGANLMKALKAKDTQAEFRYFGGDLMQAEGGTLVKHYADMAYMGFVEVFLNLRTIMANMKHCKQDISTWHPDVLILIDFPGFNLKIAEFAKAQGLMVCFYISPKVWAWNQKRVHQIKRVVDHLFCILPFEVEFYQQWDMQVDYVGNPLLDAIAAFTPDSDFLQKHHLTEKKIIALLPGSRKQEISKLLPVMATLTQRFPDYQFIVAGAPAFDLAYYQQYLNNSDIPVLFNATYDLLHHAEAAIVASGTAVLETALFNVPQVAVYKANWVMVVIARTFLKIKYITLVNLIMNKRVVQELIQEECNTDTISDELNKLLPNSSTDRQNMLQDYHQLHQFMGQPGASARTAELIVSYTLQKNKSLN
ncbi:lipid-A-disaccharide synthase [Mucilaginibacter robiniae]|uniref:Lipid-A-disaccharide synthase n=1 Tax=Mucilaginibacter robiniae TaxID=2728022 RepID=A0A7L5E180_9SPHI|nr:lipid-A-disaccharide synthase [Mucilaginibacter robiniae]QJD94583.1 lipid-A-disaccharide synthase [Mucilaginibacter robiniae]